MNVYVGKPPDAVAVIEPGTLHGVGVVSNKHSIVHPPTLNIPLTVSTFPQASVIVQNTSTVPPLKGGGVGFVGFDVIV